MRVLAVEQHSTQDRLCSTALYRADPASTPVIHQKRCITCLTLPLPRLMSAHHNLRSCSLLKTVFNNFGATYQAYCNTYNTHTMATHHRGTGQPLDRDAAQHGQDTDIPNNYHHEDMDNSRTGESHQHDNPYLGPRWFMPQSSGWRRSTHESHTSHRVQTPQIITSTSSISTTGTPWQCTTAIHRNLMFCPKQTTFAYTLIWDIPAFNGSNSTQLEDWLVDIETVAIWQMKVRLN